PGARLHRLRASLATHRRFDTSVAVAPASRPGGSAANATRCSTHCRVAAQPTRRAARLTAALRAAPAWRPGLRLSATVNTEARLIGSRVPLGFDPSRSIGTTQLLEQHLRLVEMRGPLTVAEREMAADLQMRAGLFVRKSERLRCRDRRSPRLQ